MVFGIKGDAMKTTREKRTETISLRVSSRVKAVIEELAMREHRTVSQQVHKWVIEALAAAKKQKSNK